MKKYQTVAKSPEGYSEHNNNLPTEATVASSNTPINNNEQDLNVITKDGVSLPTLGFRGGFGEDHRLV